MGMADSEKSQNNPGFVNPGKSLEIEAMGKKFLRYAVKTHYIRPGQDHYIDIIQKYVLPVYRKGDIISISEKIISICQGRVVYKKDVRVTKLARFLSKYVHTTPAGEHIAIPEKMQVAMNSAGRFRMLVAAAVAAVTRPFGIKGLFYKIAGRDVAALDGFETDGFQDYNEMAILCPEDSNAVCEDIRQKTGVDCMIVDANDLGVEILGVGKNIPYSVEQLRELIRDNPTCQEDECTPILLIRQAS
jgi:F420-0:gamma-glutamyl ligase-like protein